MRILFLCTGNSCRSPMAEGFAKHLMPKYEIYSAGVDPEKNVSQYSVLAMSHIGIDISKHLPMHVSLFQNMTFDRVICFGQKSYQAAIKLFSANSVEFYDVIDPWGTKGNEVEVLNVYLNTANQIRKIVAQLIYYE